ncbi:MAG: hypothetical protein H6712_08725 [Myxococcales bacterium]|nr:hypothetical protein [Myxococcales bacterium]MCB9713923.1 hypothetical protein [Myxococcales bacterium]
MSKKEARARSSGPPAPVVAVGDDDPGGSWGEALDELGAAVFDGEPGRHRLAPLWARWDDEAAPLRDEDPDYSRWQMIRTDWALCDARAHDATGPGDTWARRAAAGRLPGWTPRDVDVVLATSFCGLFEVWAGKVPWLRDCVGGVCVALADPVRLEPVGGKGPAALWEARVVIEQGRAQLCRPPLSYPLEILETVRERSLRRFAPGGRPLSMATLRRARLRWRRAERADARVMFQIID